MFGSAITLAITLGLTGSALNLPLVVKESIISAVAYVRVVKYMQGYILGKSALFATWTFNINVVHRSNSTGPHWPGNRAVALYSASQLPIECHTCRGYILGGLMWFAVPFTLATTLGLTGLALDLPLSVKEVSSGLVPPAVAYHLFGKGGVILVTIMVFMVRDVSSQMCEMTILRVDGNAMWSCAEY